MTSEPGTPLVFRPEVAPQAWDAAQQYIQHWNTPTHRGACVCVCDLWPVWHSRIGLGCFTSLSLKRDKSNMNVHGILKIYKMNTVWLESDCGWFKEHDWATDVTRGRTRLVRGQESARPDPDPPSASVRVETEIWWRFIFQRWQQDVSVATCSQLLSETEYVRKKTTTTKKNQQHDTERYKEDNDSFSKKKRRKTNYVTIWDVCMVTSHNVLIHTVL